MTEFPDDAPVSTAVMSREPGWVVGYGAWHRYVLPGGCSLTVWTNNGGVELDTPAKGPVRLIDHGATMGDVRGLVRILGRDR